MSKKKKQKHSDRPRVHRELEFPPIVYKLPKLELNILRGKIDPIFSSNIDYPKFSLGFHHYIHQTKDKMENVVKQFDGKKKVYRVIHPFERYIDEYDRDIGGYSKIYFKGKSNILSRAFYKLWELFFMFDLVPTTGSITTAHLAEGPGSFIQATMFYRDMFDTGKRDKYYAVTIHPEGTKEYVPALDKKLIEISKKDKRVQLHRTYSIKESRKHKNRDNGDLTNPKTIKLFGGKFDKNADFITADGGFNWKNENTQEQEAFKLIYAQILMALKIQKKGGNFVCKFYESYTTSTVKLMCILSACYTSVTVVKPLTSRQSNSEKYLVCLGYKGVESKIIKMLEDTLKIAYKNKKRNIVDIFPSYDISQTYLTTITKLNTDIANKQYVSINHVVDFVNKQNFRGSEYKKRREQQIKASEHWISRFLPEKKAYKKSKSVTMKDTETIIENNRISTNRLGKALEG